LCFRAPLLTHGQNALDGAVSDGLDDLCSSSPENNDLRDLCSSTPEPELPSLPDTRTMEEKLRE
jgi:hypothetical protein